MLRAAAECIMVEIEIAVTVSAERTISSTTII